ERALTLLALAELQRARRATSAAAAASDEARAILLPLRAAPALDRAATIITPPSIEARPAGLTPREVEVLALIAGGRNNAEIADALFLSVRTVERHINGLYTKIDARGRADAVAFAARHGLLPG
ncbi:MAG TPA: helix-turn-helix transcriptional regulator, partial [Thermomicrobiales bacterium]